ncbi:phytoene desaturase family protein [Salisediminibacterium halotolerans]|uniref:Phytoene desaturase n=1 Tax=Salisediminibacterium halotolerans TaxID=517425 RepID=A0A1H9PAZ0_9BACI|nr:phytoene desaturase family protein [Salisediminibacterium haloalkalitolerans]SER45317.1 phytoene desaturase [Salisediminibacterium haloalkalitolerans]
MKTAVIGGGIGGMITALYLEQRGDDVTIYDDKSRLGGRLGFAEHENFKIDIGPTIVLLPDMIETVLNDVGIDPGKLKMERIDPVYPLHFRDGTTITKWSEPNNQKEEIERLFPGQGKNFTRYMEDMNERFTEGKKAFLDKSFVRKRAFWTKNNLRTLYKLRAYRTVEQQAKKYFDEQKLQEAFSLQTLYIGGSPASTPAMYSLVPFSEHQHGIWYIHGGYGRLAELLAETLTYRNITIQLETKVQKIEMDEQLKRAKSLVTDRGREVFDRFVLNGDFPVAEKLVKEKPSRSYEPSSGCLLMFFGLNGALPTDHVHQFFMGDELQEQMNDIFHRRVLPKDPSFYVFNPSLIDDTLAPKGQSSVYILVPVPAACYNISRSEYLQLAEKMIGEVTERVDREFREKIVWRETRTPLEAENEGMFAGGSFGLAPTLLQSGVFRPQVKPYDYENIYAVGASVHPGGGIPIVMHGAKLLAEWIDEEEKYNTGVGQKNEVNL